MSQSCLSAILFAILATWASFAVAEEKPVEIPLREVWAYDMPGTRNVYELQPKGYVRPSEMKEASEPLKQIIEALGYRNWPKEGAAAGTCFAVSGSGFEALQAARDVFLKKAERLDKLPAGQDVTLVFYSYVIGVYVHITDVKERDHEISLGYNLVPHTDRGLTTHIALIPLGKLAPGKYEVTVAKLPLPKEYAKFRTLDEATVRRMVCGSSSFEVVGK